MRILTALLTTVVLTGCTSKEVVDEPPEIWLSSPSDGAVFGGTTTLDVEFGGYDDYGIRTIDVLLDDEVVHTEELEAPTEEYESVSGVVQISIAEIAEGAHTLTLQATDLGENVVDLETPVNFELYDIPYITKIEVSNTQEGGFNGPLIEVEVHILDVATDSLIGCAGENTGLGGVENDNQVYDVSAHFVNYSGGLMIFPDLAERDIQFVGIESDAGSHCPTPADLTDELTSDDDDLYGVSRTISASEFLETEVQVPVGDMRTLRVAKGRPW
jgi:hypothetical protein